MLGRRGGKSALFEEPLPRRMASRPVDWMVVTMVEGAAVPVMVSVCVAREAAMVVMPGESEYWVSWVGVVLGIEDGRTGKLVHCRRDFLHTRLAVHGHCKGGLEGGDHCLRFGKAM